MNDPAESRADGGPEPADPLARIRRVTRVMDDAVEIPFLGLRVGLDALIGLIPGVGDVAGAAVGGWIVVTAARLGASGGVLIRMLANAGVDALVGAVPVLGDVFDLAFRANRRNLRLLEAHVQDPAGTHLASRRLIGSAVAGVIALLVGLVLVMGWALVAVSRAIAG